MGREIRNLRPLLWASLVFFASSCAVDFQFERFSGRSTLGAGGPSVPPSGFPAVQQGNKLVASPTLAGVASQAYSLGISADGDTIIVGGPSDNVNIGAAWIFVRVAGVWSQQAKLVGTGYTGGPQQGTSVALSGDGNTALVGGYTNAGSVGAVWVFTRSGSSWSQEAGPLVGTGGVNGQQGTSVALSYDGNTAAVGGYNDSSLQGATWIFTRSGTSWSQQGSKLVGTGNTGAAYQGYSIGLSSDGDTLLVGGYMNNSCEGGAWVFTRSGTTWSQQAGPLVGTGGTTPCQGMSVALSADGNTAALGGYNDNWPVGATWIFSRSGSTWTQQGAKIVGSGATDAAQGMSVGLSGDGNILIVGGPYHSSFTGASWVFTRSGGTWTQQGTFLTGTNPVGNSNFGYTCAISADGLTAIFGGYGDTSSTGATWVFTP